MSYKKISYKELLLDVNNFRFFRDINDEVAQSEMEKKELQDKAFADMHNDNSMRKRVDNLKNRIIELGWDECQAPLVIKSEDSEKYIVKDGNTRLTAIKLLIKDNEEYKSKKGKDKWPEIINQLEKIQCFDLSEKSSREIHDILDNKHINSARDWPQDNQNFAMFKIYMDKKFNVGKWKFEDFEYDTKIVKKISKNDFIKIGKQIKQYVAHAQVLKYIQDGDEDSEGRELHELIKMIVASNPLKKHYKFDTQTSLFEEEGLEMFKEDIFGTKEKEQIIFGAVKSEKGTLLEFKYLFKPEYRDQLSTVIDRIKPLKTVYLEIKRKEQDRGINEYLDELQKEIQKKTEENWKNFQNSTSETKLKSIVDSLEIWIAYLKKKWE